MEWIEIKRDKDGFATEECWNEMFENALIIIARRWHCRVLYEVIKWEDQEDWRGEINRDIRYTHYLPIPKLQL